MNFIPLMSPSIPEASIEGVVKVLRSGMLVQGENVAAFEEEVANYLGAKHVVAVSNGTATLHLALLALGIGPGDEVILPALSYIATANVIEIVGAECVFVDVERDTFNIASSAIEARITSRTKAIMPVHEFGLACDIHRIKDIAKTHGLFVIEDAACALGATDSGSFAGMVGEVGSFSLHPRKAVTSGEGGLLVTDQDELARKLRILRNHGIDPDREGMHFVAAGLNYRMTDFQAALVRPQFGNIEENIDRKNELAKVYFDCLKDVDGIRLPSTPADKKHTWQTFHTVLDKSIDRESVIGEMKAAGIGTNLAAQCIPHMQFYREKYGLDSSAEFPNALDAFNQGLALPIYDKLSREDVEYISKSLKEVVGSR